MAPRDVLAPDEKEPDDEVEVVQQKMQEVYKFETLVTTLHVLQYYMFRRRRYSQCLILTGYCYKKCLRRCAGIVEAFIYRVLDFQPDQDPNVLHQSRLYQRLIGIGILCLRQSLLSHFVGLGYVQQYWQQNNARSTKAERRDIPL